MGIEHLQDNLIIVDLPKEPEMGAELKAVVNWVRERCGCDVIIDFSKVDVVRSTSICQLLTLRQLLESSKHKIILYDVSELTKAIFKTTRLDTIFCFVDDKSAAFQEVEVASSPQE